MTVDIADHVLVPRHEIMTAQEKRELLQRYNVTKEGLPRMKAEDVMAKKIGAKPGDFIRIIRDSPTAGKALYYRIVVE